MKFFDYPISLAFLIYHHAISTKQEMQKMP